MRQIYYPRSFFYVSRHGPIEMSARAADRLRWRKAWRALRQDRGSAASRRLMCCSSRGHLCIVGSVA